MESPVTTDRTPIYRVGREHSPRALMARDAAAWFAQEYFPHPRHATRFALPDDHNPLAIEFQLVNGTAWYRAEWDEAAQTYAVYRL